MILKIPPMSDDKDRLIAWVSRESISGHNQHSLGRDLEHLKSKEGVMGIGFGIGIGIAVPAAPSFRCMASRSIDLDRNIYGGRGEHVQHVGHGYRKLESQIDRRTVEVRGVRARLVHRVLGTGRSTSESVSSAKRTTPAPGRPRTL